LRAAPDLSLRALPSDQSVIDAATEGAAANVESAAENSSPPSWQSRIDTIRERREHYAAEHKAQEVDVSTALTPTTPVAPPVETVASVEVPTLRQQSPFPLEQRTECTGNDVVCTLRPRPDSLEQSQRTESVDTLSKPVDWNDLIEKAAPWLIAAAFFILAWRVIRRLTQRDLILISGGVGTLLVIGHFTLSPVAIRGISNDLGGWHRDGWIGFVGGVIIATAVIIHLRAAKRR
jgi:hypothetical protein